MLILSIFLHEQFFINDVGKKSTTNTRGSKEVNVYFVNITLENKNITLNTQVTECDELSSDNSIGMLIGMNIITMGDFAVTNYDGNTTMSFRVPSLQKINFVLDNTHSEQRS